MTSEEGADDAGHLHQQAMTKRAVAVEWWGWLACRTFGRRKKPAEREDHPQLFSAPLYKSSSISTLVNENDLVDGLVAHLLHVIVRTSV